MKDPDKKCCENCGNEYCQKKIVAVLYDACIDSNYEKYWMPLPELPVKEDGIN